MASSSSKQSGRSNVRTAKPRTPSGAIGGLLGAFIMSIIAGVLVTVAVTPVVAVSGIAASSAISIFENLPNHLNPGDLAQPSTLYARDSAGNQVELATFFAQNREMVGWDEISQFVKDAAVATEDPRFYTHGGVDVMGLGRAVLGVATGRDAGGASTITMQYVRNVLVQEAEAILDEEERDAAYEAATEQATARKLQEIRYAVSIEKKYSKDEILLGYLNIALFGGNVYGIEAAAQTYYGKSAKDLTLPEAASLIAIVQFPSALNLAYEENVPDNQVRRDYVLQRMLDSQRITQEQHDAAVATDVVPNLTQRQNGCVIAENNYGLGHFCDYVQRYVEGDPALGNTEEERHFNFLRGGYSIMTTVNLDLQAASLSALRGAVPPLLDHMDIGAATSTVEVGTGRVLAMAQNRPFSADAGFLESNPGYTSINYNTDEEMGGSKGFQIGSTSKTFTLAEWLRTGHSLNDMVNANGRTVNLNSFRASCLGGVYGGGTFPVRNDSGQMPGNVSVYTATANSFNGGYISMQQQLDLCDTISIAENLGVHRASDLPLNEDGTTTVPTLRNNPRGLSVVPTATFAGVDEIAPLTMATAYAAFPNQGTWCSPVPIDSMTDAEGNEVAFTKSTCTEGVSPDVAAGVLSGLEHVLTATGRHAYSQFGVPHFLKTGTTDDNKDRWNVGGTSRIVTALWTGNVTGFDDLNYSGLGRPDRSVFADIMYAGDQIYGGDAFPAPPRSAVERVMVAIPDVRNRPYAEAEQLLTAAGFTVINGGEVDSSVTAGLVPSSNPSGEAGRGSAITLYV
ncbi:MAG: PASTA domain-containing protein, partial [Leucobacter sp.]|nr:PASTA domain-containing protein [Leucobacter sp.]